MALVSKWVLWVGKPSESGLWYIGGVIIFLDLGENIMINKELLIRHIDLLLEEDIASLLNVALLMKTKNVLAPKL